MNVTMNNSNRRPSVYWKDIVQQYFEFISPVLTEYFACDYVCTTMACCNVILHAIGIYLLASIYLKNKENSQKLYLLNLAVAELFWNIGCSIYYIFTMIESIVKDEFVERSLTNWHSVADTLHQDDDIKKEVDNQLFNAELFIF